MSRRSVSWGKASLENLPNTEKKSSPGNRARSGAFALAARCFSLHLSFLNENLPWCAPRRGQYDLRLRPGGSGSIGRDPLPVQSRMCPTGRRRRRTAKSTPATGSSSSRGPSTAEGLQWGRWADLFNQLGRAGDPADSRCDLRRASFDEDPFSPGTRRDLVRELAREGPPVPRHERAVPRAARQARALGNRRPFRRRADLGRAGVCEARPSVLPGRGAVRWTFPRTAPVRRGQPRRRHRGSPGRRDRCLLVLALRGSVAGPGEPRPCIPSARCPTFFTWLWRQERPRAKSPGRPA